jgi:hypothetical protein
MLSNKDHALSIQSRPKSAISHVDTSVKNSLAFKYDKVNSPRKISTVKQSALVSMSNDKDSKKLKSASNYTSK